MTPAFFTIRSFDDVDSTNQVAKLAAEAGEPEGLVIRAKSQSRGVGRQGRAWFSPEGNLYLSVLLRPACALPQAGHYSFAASMAVFDAIADVHHDTKLSLKWPNDLLIDEAKVSGVLLEVGSADQRNVDWIVIGVGINVEKKPEEGVSYPVTSLHAQGALCTVDDVQKAFLQHLHHWYLTLKHDGFDPVRRAWLSDAHRGPMVIRLPTGEIHGNFAGLGPDGGLILRLADGSEKVIHAGDVSLM